MNVSTAMTNSLFRTAIRRVRAAGLIVLAMLAAPAGAQDVDTSDWACEYCPFQEGYDADYDVGSTTVNGDSAWFGDATGYDEDGAYLNLSGDGSYVADDLIWDFRFDELGLDARSIDAGVRRQGTFEVDLGYRELPRREFITTRTIFAAGPSGALALPAGWVRGGSTGALPSLNASLVDRNIESDLSVLEAAAAYLPSQRWSIDATFRRREHEGNNILGGSYFTNASLLPVNFDYETDEFDLSARYATDRGFLSLSWYLSDFSSGGLAFGWESPFVTLPGAESAELAQPPENQFQQFTLSGGYRFDAMQSWVRASASFGTIEQDSALLAYTTNANLTPAALPRASLDGEVDTTRLAISAGARPLPGARLEFRASYDERDNGTPRETWSRVIADSFLSGDAELNNPYSYERTRLAVEGSYDVLDDVRLTGGVEYREIDRDLQEVAEQDELSGWGGVRWRANDNLTLRGEIGTARRDIDRYDEGLAQTFGQNPILRKYNLAYRYRESLELGADGSCAEGRLGWSLSVTGRDDSYSESPLGLISGEEWAYAGEVNWTVSEQASVYVHGGLESIESVQLGSEAFGAPDWRAANEDNFFTLGAGFRMRQIADKLDLEVDGVFSEGVSEIAMNTATGGPSQFPDLNTTLSYVNVRLSYAWSERLDIGASLRFQHFDADDWALDAVGPATIPQVLSLGAEPWDEKQYIVGLSFRYRPGRADAE